MSSPSENAGRELDERRRGGARIVVEIGQPAHRIVVEIEAARRDQAGQQLGRQPVARHRREQGRRHRVGLDVAGGFAGDRIAPPLQPDLAGQRLVNDLAHPRDLDIEGIERIERAAMLGRSEQGGEKAILVGRAHQRLAMGECILHGATLSGPAPAAIAPNYAIEACAATR